MLCIFFCSYGNKKRSSFHLFLKNPLMFVSESLIITRWLWDLRIRRFCLHLTLRIHLGCLYFSCVKETFSMYHFFCLECKNLKSTWTYIYRESEIGSGMLCWSPVESLLPFSPVFSVVSHFFVPPPSCLYYIPPSCSFPLILYVWCYVSSHSSGHSTVIVFSVCAYVSLSTIQIHRNLSWIECNVWMQQCEIG